MDGGFHHFENDFLEFVFLNHPLRLEQSGAPIWYFVQYFHWKALNS